MKSKKTKNITGEENLTGYPAYPEDEDIYEKMKEVDVDPDSLSTDPKVTGKKGIKNRSTNPIPEANELDIPGAELDDDMESAGNPDEENNYYSIGGDKHEDLEEDKGS